MQKYQVDENGRLLGPMGQHYATLEGANEYCRNRVVACLNACDFLSQNELENIPRLRALNAELLAALELVLRDACESFNSITDNCKSWTPYQTQTHAQGTILHLHDIARAAIARAKGESS